MLFLIASGCAAEDELQVATTEQQGGIEGANCAGASPVMLGPDQVAYPFPSVEAYYYRKLEAAWKTIATHHLLQTSLPNAIEATSQEFFTWQAKSIEIFQNLGKYGYRNKFFTGVFGVLEGDDDADDDCVDALDEDSRYWGLLYHTALSQADQCGIDPVEGTKKYYKVKRLTVVRLGAVIDAYDLVRAGMAYELAAGDPEPPYERCILRGFFGNCAIAYRNDTVTEGIVLGLDTDQKVAGTPLVTRTFTAAGTEPMPNGLDEVRTIVRSSELSVMKAIGLPVIERTWATPTEVRVASHRVGPMKEPSSILSAFERQQVDSQVQLYANACCTPCPVTRNPAPTATLGIGIGGGSDISLDGGLPDATGSDGSGGGSDTCTPTCLDEGVCQTSSVFEGVVILVSSVTTSVCEGSCPMPANPGISPPTCSFTP